MCRWEYETGHNPRMPGVISTDASRIPEVWPMGCRLRKPLCHDSLDDGGESMGDGAGAASAVTIQACCLRVRSSRTRAAPG